MDMMMTRRRLLGPFAPRYGVRGVGQRESALTRVWHSKGMTAQVGTDGDNSGVINDFDSVDIFNRRKCVGRWTAVNGRAKFEVLAYYGDANYTEDGSMGDYVAVECPRAYYYRKGDVLAVSAQRHNSEWRCFDVFCRNHNQDDTLEYVYLPAYSLASKNGKAVSLPGLDNDQGDYKTLFDITRTYNSNASSLAMLEPFAVFFYEWAMYTVEFAQQDPKVTMRGCISLRNNLDDTVRFTDATHAITNNYDGARVVGQCVTIAPTTEPIIHIEDVRYQATHRITGIVRCDENGNASDTGDYQLLTLEDLGKNYFTYTIGTTYRLASRPWRTGSCNGVSTPSGSPVSNSSGYYPMKYRWRENIFGNQYHACVDLFTTATGPSSSRVLSWYLLEDPTTMNPAVNFTTAPPPNCKKLSVTTPSSGILDFYATDWEYDPAYPDIRIPKYVSNEGSGTTYSTLYATLTGSAVVRTVRLGSRWTGDILYYGMSAPSRAYATFGGALCFAQ